jgi:hypothetical protein
MRQNGRFKTEARVLRNARSGNGFEAARALRHGYAQKGWLPGDLLFAPHSAR